MNSKFCAWTRKSFTQMNNVIINSDRFATPISFNFKGKESFKTWIGGFVSITILTYILIYLSFLIKVLVNREASTINYTPITSNLVYDSGKYNHGSDKYIYFFFELILPYSMLYSPPLSSPPISLTNSWSLAIIIEKKNYIENFSIRNYFKKDILNFSFH